MVSYKPDAEYLNYKVVGLNPCCSGRWSRTGSKCRHAKKAAMGLNPYCSGQWSSTVLAAAKEKGRTES